MAEQEEGVTITFRDMYDEIVGMRADVQSLTQTRESTADTLDDHESRLRSIERWKYGIPVTTICAVASTVAAFLIH
jgi:hypothetical protein